MHSSAGLMALKNVGAKTHGKNLNQMLGNFCGVSYKTNRSQRLQLNQTTCKKHLHFIKNHSMIRYRLISSVRLSYEELMLVVEVVDLLGIKK